MKGNPLGEVFGFPPEDSSARAKHFRNSRLCPFNNKVPNCTKDKAENPLGVCSIRDGENLVITCPVRFRQDWAIVQHAAEFFFGPGVSWTTLTEVKLPDADGKSAGNIDVVLVAYDEAGEITDFGALEIQAVYISGNVRRPFEAYIKALGPGEFDWSHESNYPRADFLSSSRKRLAPQLLFKGGILHQWGRKMAVGLDLPFFETLPMMREVSVDEAEIAWLVYSIRETKDGQQNNLELAKVIYTKFEESLFAITQPKVGNESDFVKLLKAKLDLKRGTIPPTTTEVVVEF